MKIGDVLILHSKTAEWEGFRAQVVEVEALLGGGEYPYLRPLSDRPDGHGLSNFYWDTLNWTVEQRPAGALFQPSVPGVLEALTQEDKTEREAVREALTEAGERLFAELPADDDLFTVADTRQMELVHLLNQAAGLIL